MDVAGPRILIADDDPTARRLLKVWVHALDSIDEAMLNWLWLQPAIGLMDWSAPSMCRMSCHREEHAP
jgi:CheY-like chemotaxis protein